VSDKANLLDQICSELGIAFDVDHYRALVARADSPPSVAILGLVSRGKSTLVNELIGMELCPVSAKGETVATVEISAGPPNTRAWADDGSQIDIDSNPMGFSRRIRRDAIPNAVRATFAGSLRLPPGVVIVDTPGIDDAATVDQQLSYLERHWTRSGSSAALVVVSVPPGLGRTDVDFIGSARKIFGRSMTVVVKAIDSSIDSESLAQVAEEVERHLGHAPITLPNSNETGSWRAGKTALVDAEIDRLMNVARTTANQTADDLNGIIKLLCQAIDELPTGKLKTLGAHAQNAKTVDPELGRRVSNRIASLQNEIAKQDLIARQREVDKKQRFWDQQVAQLVGLLPGSAQRFNTSHREPLAELAALASQGSEAALKAIVPYMALTIDERTRAGLTVIRLLKAFKVRDMPSVLAECDLSETELESLVRGRLSDSEAIQILNKTKFLRSVERLEWTGLTKLYGCASTDQVRQAVGTASIAFLERRIGEISDKLNGLYLGGNFDKSLMSLSGFSDRISWIEKELATTTLQRTHELQVRNILQEVGPLGKRLTQKYLELLQLEQAELLSQSPLVSASSAKQRRDYLLPLTLWLERQGLANQEAVRFFRDEDRLLEWARRCESERLRCVREIERTKQIRLGIRVGALFANTALLYLGVRLIISGANPFFLYPVAVILLGVSLLFLVGEELEPLEWTDLVVPTVYGDPPEKKVEDEPNLFEKLKESIVDFYRRQRWRTDSTWGRPALLLTLGTIFVMIVVSGYHAHHIERSKDPDSVLSTRTFDVISAPPTVSTATPDTVTRTSNQTTLTSDSSTSTSTVAEVVVSTATSLEPSQGMPMAPDPTSLPQPATSIPMGSSILVINGCEIRPMTICGDPKQGPDGFVVGGADLRFADLRLVDLQGADLTAADLHGAWLTGSNLSKSILVMADLSSASLAQSDLRGASLASARLWDVNLSEANLTGADLYEASLYGSDLRGAILALANLRYAMFPFADLSGVNFSEVLNADLTDVNFVGALLVDANLVDTDLSFSDLSGANLSGANLSGANLTGANLTGANLTGANLSGANLTGVTGY
jgi:uncharacterized protein YjbI with pentapeptide repeats